MDAPKTFALQLISTHCTCQGCEKQLKKVLKKISGIHTIATDLEKGKVTIQGRVITYEEKTSDLHTHFFLISLFFFIFIIVNLP